MENKKLAAENKKTTTEDKKTTAEDKKTTTEDKKSATKHKFNIDVILQTKGDSGELLSELENYYNNDIVIEELCIMAFTNVKYHTDTYRHTIRKIFINSKRLALLILIKLEKILESQYDTIQFLFIDSYNYILDPNKLTHGKYNSETICKINTNVLIRICQLYNNFPITPHIQNTIYLSDKLKYTNFTAHSNVAFSSIMMKDIIYTRHIGSINLIIRSFTPTMLLNTLNRLDEPYYGIHMLDYIDNRNDVNESFTGKLQNRQIILYNASHLYECLLQLLDIDNLLFLVDCRMPVLLGNLKFYEYWCAYIYPKLDDKLKFNQYYYKVYRILMRFLAKKGINKYMSKFGAYDSSDNLNDCRITDMIVGYI